MCMLFFIRISALNLSGLQTKSCNFTKISKAQTLKNSRRPSINKIVYYFAWLGFGIAEYNDRFIIEKKNQGGHGVCPGKCMWIMENEVHCPGFVWKNYGMYGLTLSHTILTLSIPEKKNLVKTLEKKEKILVLAISAFLTMCSTLSWKTSLIWSPRFNNKIHGDFLSFLYISPCRTCDPRCGIKFDSRAIIWALLVDKAMWKTWLSSWRGAGRFWRFSLYMPI